MKNLLIIVVVLASVLSGCVRLRTTYLLSDVVAFHELPQGLAGTTYAMVPSKEQEGSLEHKAYEQAIKQELNEKGFREIALEQADVVVILSYGIDTGKVVVSSTGVYTDSQGKVYGGEVSSRTVYTRFFKLDLLDKKAFVEGKTKKLYEGKVESRGSTGQLVVVLPVMIKTLFEDFPGENGRTRTSKRALR